MESIATQTYNATGVIRQKQDNRFRRQLRFWLDLTIPGEVTLDEWIEELKRKRQFAATIRDSLRLFKSLREGQTAVLFKLFPNLIDKMVLDALLARGVQIPDSNVQIPQPPPLGKVIPLPESNVQIPEDDVQISIKKAASDGKAASKNFLDSAFALQ